MTNYDNGGTPGSAPHPASGNALGAGHIQGVDVTPDGLLRSTLGALAAALVILLLFWLPSEYGVDPTGLGRVMGLTQMGEIKQQLYEEAASEDAILVAQAAAERVSADPDLLARLSALEAQVAGIASALGVSPMPVSPQVVPPAATMPTPATQSPASEQDLQPASESAVDAADPQWKDEVSYTLAPTEGIEIKLAMAEGARAIFEWTANGSVLNYDTHGDGWLNSISYEQGRGVPEQSGELIAAFDGKHGWFWRNRTDEPVTFTLRTRGDYSEMVLP
jgi:hypothetical protein